MKKRILIINILIMFIVLELVSRLFLSALFHINIFQINSIVEKGMYKGVIDIPPLNDNDINILILGASVMYKDYGNIDSLIKNVLMDSLRENIKVINLSYPAHTIRDSYEKYKAIQYKNFDYIIIYHGINDVRMNNCPQHIYKDDYSHSKWFKTMEICRKHKEKGIISIPLAMHIIYEQIMQKTGNHELLPIHTPAEHWLKEGSVIKNKKTFQNYLTKIIEIADRSKSLIILSKFAYYIPSDYSEELFSKKLLDYNEHINPINIWGLAINVENGIYSNNQIMWNISRKYDLPFIFADLKIPDGKMYFNDICHLTYEGCKLLAFEFTNKIIKLRQLNHIDRE